MTTVTSLTADRMLAIEAASVVDGDVIGGNLILTKHDGSQINAGPVTGPQGPQGPVGSDLAVLNAIPVLDVGLANQIRAGRQLGPADFGNIGLSAPIGLWNLSDLSDVSGNGRNLLNKGAIPFVAGINGGANTAAQFSGVQASAFYIPDTGAADPFRLRTLTWGCWFRTAKRGVTQKLISKMPVAGSLVDNWFDVGINSNNVPYSYVQTIAILGATDIADDRWHFIVGTYDGTVSKLYVDCVLEGMTLAAPGAPVNPGPFNIGNFGTDAGNSGALPHFGRIDEAFVTSDILSEDQVRNLYCAKIPHTLAVVPSRLSLNVRRRKKGSGFAVADFPTQPLRLYNFSGGSLGDEGSNGVALTINGAAVSVSGVDGSGGNAFNLPSGSYLSANDAGLPAALSARSYSCWFKTMSTPGAGQVMFVCGIAGADSRISIAGTAANQIFSGSGSDTMIGPVITDGQWHQVIVTEDNNAIDGVKRKMYLDGRIVANSTVMNSVTLGGANKFRIGIYTDGSSSFIGQVDGVFICDYALTSAQIAALYAKGSQALAPSPKSVGAHVEAMDAASLLATFDTLESQHQIDLKVAA